MPTYTYKCEKCGEVFDVFQSIKAEPLKIHDNCGGKLKRLIGKGAGIIFKGSGFYETDFKRKTQPKKETSKKESKSSTDKNSSSENKTKRKTSTDN